MSFIGDAIDTITSYTPIVAEVKHTVKGFLEEGFSGACKGFMKGLANDMIGTTVATAALCAIPGVAPFAIAADLALQAGDLAGCYDLASEKEAQQYAEQEHDELPACEQCICPPMYDAQYS